MTSNCHGFFISMYTMMLGAEGSCSPRYAVQ